jgi:hypothetical protein
MFRITRRVVAIRTHNKYRPAVARGQGTHREAMSAAGIRGSACAEPPSSSRDNCDAERYSDDRGIEERGGSFVMNDLHERMTVAFVMDRHLERGLNHRATDVIGAAYECLYAGNARSGEAYRWPPSR